jgi:hypothetical protein
MYLVKGKVVDDFDFPSVEVEWMDKVALWDD